jgi:hypothetical protein
VLHDVNEASAEGLAARLREHYPEVRVRTGSNDPSAQDLVVNATPMGMNPGDPLPVDVTRIAPSTFVGEVVMKQEMTAFLEAARARGCRIQVGTDMLFEQIPRTSSSSLPDDDARDAALAREAALPSRDFDPRRRVIARLHTPARPAVDAVASRRRVHARDQRARLPCRCLPTSSAWLPTFATAA